MKRILTSLVLIPIVTYAVLWAPVWFFLVILGSIGLLCLHEFSGIVAANGIARPHWLMYPAGLAVMLTAGREFTGGLVAVVALALALVSMREDFRHTLEAASASVLGVFYVFGSWRCAVELRQISPWWLLFALALNWAGDIAALYFGRAFGRHKMAPRISPGKSWEGAAASALASMVFGAVYGHFLLPATPLVWILFLALAGNAAGQLGDLAESAMKRGAGLKDSGNLLPGHGGWLDRVDSSLFAVPVVWFLLQMLDRFSRLT